MYRCASHAILKSFLCVSLLGCAAAYAQTPAINRVTLQNATVFLRGAELTSTTTVNLPAGDSDVVFTNVAGNINAQTLAVEVDGGAIVLSSRVQNDFLGDDAMSPQAAEIKQQIEKLQADRQRVADQLDVIKAQVNVLTGERIASNEAPVSAAEMARILDLIDKRMTPLLATRLRLQQDLTRLDEQIAKAQKQQAELQQRNLQPGGQVVVRFHAPRAMTSQVRMTYVVPDAGWVPSYDIQVKEAGAPVGFTYKATVFQNSGIGWNGVRLTLSSSNPSESAQAPTLSPRYLSLYRPQPVAAMAPMPAPPAPVAMAMESRRTQQQALDGYVTTNAEGINTTFAISLPYSIPSDGKGHVVMVKSAELRGDYRYVVTPKLDTDAFLQVLIGDWGRLNLLPGRSNIFYAGSFVGQGNIDPRRAKETINVSLGRDKNIIVTRDVDKANTGKPEFFGNDVRNTYAYTINVRNTRANAVKLAVFDQVPVSRSAEVVVQDVTIDNGGVHNPETGELQWLLNLAPNETRQLHFGYVVKYPKDAQVGGL